MPLSNKDKAIHEMPDNAEIAQKDKTAVWHHLTQHKNFETSDPFIVAEDRGMIVIDTKGNEYLDAISGGAWSVNVGYGRDRISEKSRSTTYENVLLCGKRRDHSGGFICRSTAQKCRVWAAFIILTQAQKPI